MESLGGGGKLPPLLVIERTKIRNRKKIDEKHHFDAVWME